MHHLGSRVSALTDGQLGPADTERALAHAAGCRMCARELEAARQARRALSVAPDVGPGPDLTARLLALGAPPAAGAGTGGPDRTSRQPQRPVVPLGLSAYAAPARALSGDLTARRRPGARFAAATLVGLGVAALALLVLGERPAVVPTAHPAEALSLLGRASGPGDAAAATLAPELAATVANATSFSTAGRGATDAAVLSWMRDGGWTCPAGLPDGYRITAARLTGDRGAVLELDLAGPDGQIVLTEERGRLEVAALGEVPRIVVGDRSVLVLNRQPWHVAWQSGDTAVSIVSDASTRSVSELVAGFPAAGYDDGLSARLSRGWDTVTGALAHP